jgi:transposase-like protein
MRGVIDHSLRERVVQLRVQERLSLNEIASRTGASKGSLSGWLRQFPLTAEERAAKSAGARRYVQPKKSLGQRSRLCALVGDRDYSRHQKAKIAEAAVLLRLVLFGMTPYGSVFDGDKADWFVETPKGRALKIQVKWAMRKAPHGLPVVSLLCRDGHAGYRRYREGDFDAIVGYLLHTDTCYVWSFEELVDNKTCVTVRHEAEERWDKLLGP